MKSDYRIRSLRANFSKRGWVWSSRVQSGPVSSSDGSDLLFCGLGSWKTLENHDLMMTTCQERGKVQLLTAGPFPPIHWQQLFIRSILCVYDGLDASSSIGGPVHTLALLPKQKGPAKHGPGASSGSCFNQVLKFGSSDEALNAQSPRMGSATFTPAIFKPLEDRGWASRECAAAVLSHSSRDITHSITRIKITKGSKMAGPRQTAGNRASAAATAYSGSPTSSYFYLLGYLQPRNLRFMDSCGHYWSFMIVSGSWFRRSDSNWRIATQLACSCCVPIV